MAAPVAALSVLPSLAGLDREKLGLRWPPSAARARAKMRVNQLWHWIYLRGATDFAEMTNVSKTLRAQLAEHYSLARPEIIVEQVVAGRHPQVAAAPAGGNARRAPPRGGGGLYSRAGSRHAVRFQPGGLHAELRLLPHTGTQRLVRNLTAAEIVAQVLVARDRLGDYPGRERAVGPGLPTEGDRLVTNIVFMGMGRAALRL